MWPQDYVLGKSHSTTKANVGIFSCKFSASFILVRCLICSEACATCIAATNNLWITTSEATQVWSGKPLLFDAHGCVCWVEKTIGMMSLTSSFGMKPWHCLRLSNLCTTAAWSLEDLLHIFFTIGMFQHGVTSYQKPCRHTHVLPHNTPFGFTQTFPGGRKGDTLDTSFEALLPPRAPHVVLQPWVRNLVLWPQLRVLQWINCWSRETPCWPNSNFVRLMIA